jgi:hypothetical protein
MSTIELTRFRVRPERVEALLSARPRLLQEFRADRVGQTDEARTEKADDQWLDIVTWRSPEDFAASRAKGANLPGINAFFAAIDELVSDEQGVLSDSGEAS